MKSIIASIALTAFMVPVMAQDYGSTPDACSPVFAACEAQGYKKDMEAPAGKKVWADCAGPVMAGKPVAGLKLDGKIADRCFKFKTAKTQFEKDWNAKN